MARYTIKDMKKAIEEMKNRKPNGTPNTEETMDEAYERVFNYEPEFNEITYEKDSSEEDK